MNYFTSCIYGDYSRFKQIKDDLRESDHLWILGDILDGNNENPSENIDIMDDIIKSDNITLILGDHEYARCMKYSASGDAEASEVWEKYSTALDISGMPFNEFIADNFSQDDYDNYFGAFLTNCELTAVVPIGGHYFYLCHGTPEHYANSIILAWQLRVCTKLPDFKKSLFSSIQTDEFAMPYLKAKMPMTEANTIVISGQLSSAEAAETLSVEDPGTGFIYANKILALGRRTTEEPINVIGIDAAGFFLQGRY